MLSSSCKIFCFFSSKSVYYLDLLYADFYLDILILLVADPSYRVLRNENLLNSLTVTRLLIWILVPLSEVTVIIFYVSEIQITSFSRLKLYLNIYETSWKALGQHKMFSYSFWAGKKRLYKKIK